MTRTIGPVCDGPASRAAAYAACSRRRSDGRRVVVHRLGKQGMAESVGAVPIRVVGQQLRGECPPCSGSSRSASGPPRPRRAALVPAIDRPRRPSRAPLGILGERRHARLEDFAQGLRQASGGALGPAPRAWSSSMKNGLPSARRSSPLRRSASTSWPRIAGSARRALPGRTATARPSHARQAVHFGQPGAERMAAVQLVGPVRPDHDECSSRMLRARKATRSRVEPSAQCRSSRTHTTGTRSPRVAQQREQALEDHSPGPTRGCELADLDPPPAPRTPGSSGRARPSPVSPRSSSWTSPNRPLDRSAGRRRNALDDWGEREAATLTQADATTFEDDRATGLPPRRTP